MGLFDKYFNKIQFEPFVPIEPLPVTREQHCAAAKRHREIAIRMMQDEFEARVARHEFQVGDKVVIDNAYDEYFKTKTHGSYNLHEISPTKIEQLLSYNDETYAIVAFGIYTGYTSTDKFVEKFAQYVIPVKFLSASWEYNKPRTC